MLLQFEKSFDADAVQKWSNDIKSVSLWSSAIYLVLIFAGRYAMRQRAPFTLRLPLVMWNTVLALFSIVGFIRTIPEMVSGIVLHGWSYSVCNTSWYYGTTGFWAYAFVLSKLLELGDTAFIVLRKQSLIFLHWYHHITVMIYCFYSYPAHVASGRWYMVMNYGIHSVMYSYFLMRSLRVRMPSVVRIGVTSLQIVQMATGLVVAMSVYVLKEGGMECSQSYENIGATLLMYVSYLILFVQFFCSEYTSANKRKTEKVAGDEKKKFESNGVHAVSNNSGGDEPKKIK